MQKKNQGFSLVELIVVIAIMAVLIAVLVPGLLYYVNKSRKATCENNRDELRRMMNEQHTEDMASGTEQTPATVFNALITDYPRSCPSGGTISLTSGSDWDTYTLVCSVHTDSGTESANLGQTDTMATVISAIQKYYSNTNGRRDSGAASDPTSKTAQIVAQLQKDGIDLSSMGAATWSYQTIKDSSNKSQQVFYWTPEDISKKSSSDQVYVMRYNLTTKTYSVWKMSIHNYLSGNKAFYYNALYAPIGNSITDETSAENQTYENALKTYQAAVAGGN